MTDINNLDLIIIGSGQAAGPLAQVSASKGWSVAVVESQFAGGTCINTGCTPTKTLVASARAAYVVRNGEKWGLGPANLLVDWLKIRRRRDDIVEEFRRGSLRGLENTEGITYFNGRASFTAPGEIEVIFEDGSKERLRGKRIVLDVGGEPVIPVVEGLADVPWVDSAGIQAIEELPRRLVILGGGYIGLEFSQMFRRFGCEVAIVHRGSHLLSREDKDVAAEMEKMIASEGVEIITGAVPESVSPDNSGGFRLTLKRAGDTVQVAPPQSIPGDLLLAAVGRRPATDGLNLEAAGITTDERGFIEVDDTLAASAEGIWAVGDCKGGPAFTHISYDDYRVLRDLWFSESTSTPRTGTAGRPVPYTVFTDPQLGRIGLSEKQALSEGIPFEVYSIPFSWIARALESGESAGLMKVIASPDDGRLLGAAILGMEGGELATMISLAMAGGLTVSDLRDGIFPHPGLAEAFNNLFSYGKRNSE
ncbi:MAG: mercuric reductase [Spirochaetaceae bacterium]|nr:mercuric reductase [Spirochaetaceae bacterium]